MYASYADYVTYFGGDITESQYAGLAIEADRVMDIATTGCDNVRKLREAYPVDDTELIVYCACKLAHTLNAIASYDNAAGYTSGEHGMQAKAVSSVSAGNESISYASAADSAIAKAAADPAEKAKLLQGIVRELLSGIEDANGVNLLYMGEYPCILTP